jgi:Tol biopolymer transport system component
MIRNSIFVTFILITLFSCQKNPTRIVEEEVKEKILKTEEVIFFSSDRDGEAKNIFIMTTNGEIIKRITNHSWGEFAATAISPDSNHLLFYQAVPGLDIDVGMDIYIYKIKEDTILGPITQGHPGNFFPNGEKFVFHRHTFTPEGGYESVYIYDLINNSETKLTEDGISSFYAQISPDGNIICYETSYFWESDSMSCWQLHLMDIMGNYITSLTSAMHGYYAGNGVFTPDSKSVIFYYNEKTWCYDICKIDIASKNIEYLTQNRFTGRYDITSNFKNPNISKDGDKVYFYSNFIDYQYPHPRDIYSVNIGGTGLKNITNDSYWDSHPISGFVSYYVEK